MRLTVILFTLTLVALGAQAQTLAERLAQANNEAENVSNHLLSLPPGSLNSDDYLVLAEAQLRLRQKEAAMDSATKALERATEPNAQAFAYLTKAQIYGILYRDTAIAITQLQRAEQLLQHREDKLSLALYSDVLQNFAQAYNQLGNIPQAIPYAERSLALAIKQQHPAAELKARITLGRLTLQNNAYGQAYQHLNKALALASRLKDDDALASIHLRLGMAYRKIEDHPQALVHLLQAKQRYQQLQRPSSYTYTLIYIGETYLEDASTATQAESYLTEALQLAYQQSDSLRVGIATLGLGRLAVLQQHYDLAVQHFNHAQQLFRQQNVQTYLQEASLALAELQLQRQQYGAADNLMQQLSPQMSESAVYLQLRFYELAANLYARQQNWPLAYEAWQQASQLRLTQLAEQNSFQLDIINQGLQQSAAASEWQAELVQQQQQLKQQQRDINLLLGALALLLVALLLSIIWLRRPKVQHIVPTLALSADWSSFCQRIHQASNHNISLLAFTPTNGQPLKRRYGEQHLQQALQSVLQQLDTTVLYSHCIDNDVLWLAIHADSVNVSELQQTLAQQLYQQHQSALPEQKLLSLYLPLAQLLAKPWHSSELNALREALWLSWALCESQPAPDNLWLAALYSNQTRACEWRSAMVRQDLLNAIRLGSVQLHCNNHLLAAMLADTLQ
ncbi:hypothetical protein [Rheinheimera maricola]|uniref:Tetratricopeptide repeat protein n=1 Tax=Rheinheimera maricola TaxID=2793282 RepID=A0ABS7XBX0_9GAMM|nr:hypothetical protein [Rheinheimera maricola]MBZ9612267.1 hypothetical protein [Rheinheimera maricola]